MKLEESECPGEGRCHGCMVWCDLCGNVGHTCDYPECDHHRRLEELERDIKAAEKEAAQASSHCRRCELEIREWRDQGNIPISIDDFSRHEEWLKGCEQEVLDCEKRISEIRYSIDQGQVMVPRKKQETSDSQ